MFTLENKVAVITGGGSGIGKAVALIFAQQGATVQVIDLNTEQANQTVAEIRRRGERLVALPAMFPGKP